MKTTGEERRKYPRVRRELTGALQHDGPGVLNHIDNLSANGILCHTIKPVPLMTKLGMALDLPRPFDKRLECEGIVVRCEPHDSGDDHFKVAILFTHMEEDDRELLEHFVSDGQATAAGA